MNLVLGCAAFGVPSESADASLLLAWLSRNMAMPAGCVLNMPPELPDSIAEHVAHLLQRLMKDCCRTCSRNYKHEDCS